MLIVFLIDIHELGAICPTQAGKCPDDKICGAPTMTATADDCETKLIAADPACLHYTYDADDADGDGNKCTFYSECATPDATACPNCVSGPKSCGGGKIFFLIVFETNFLFCFSILPNYSSGIKNTF
jgi:hypothetical protein